jgi:hypothetical protein
MIPANSQATWPAQKNADWKGFVGRRALSKRHGKLRGIGLATYIEACGNNGPPCRTNPLGVKGAGEAGAIGSSPAVMNAILDALYRAYRIRHLDMPATPERIWAAIHDGKRMHTL